MFVCVATYLSGENCVCLYTDQERIRTHHHRRMTFVLKSYEIEHNLQVTYALLTDMKRSSSDSQVHPSIQLKCELSFTTPVCGDMGSYFYVKDTQASAHCQEIESYVH